MKPVLFFACALALSLPAQSSQFIDSFDGQFDMSEYLGENAFGFLPVPIIISEPAVDQGLGLAGLFFHEDDVAAEKRKEALSSSESPSQHLLPPSISFGAGLYTGNDSYMVAGGHMGFYRQGKLRYEGAIGYGSINLDYYGVGDISVDQPFSLNTEALFITNTLKLQVADLPLYIGPTQSYINAELSPNGLESWLPPQTPPELVDELTELLTADVVTSGVGFQVQVDTRDNIFTPMQGFVYELEYLIYDDIVGSDLDYDNWSLAGLNYFKFSEHWRFALRLDAEAVDSDEVLPPFAVPGITLRGIPAARYQGERVAVIEGELTWQIDTRWSALAFLGSGWADNSTSDLLSSGSVVNKGLGFRYNIARRYGMHVGIDVAQGPEDTVWYIQVGSAW